MLSRVEVMKILIHPKLSDRHRRVLLALCTFVDSEGHCFPSLAMIAERSGVRAKDVSMFTADLEEAGFLKVLRLGKRCNNRYQVLKVIPQKSGNHSEGDSPKSGEYDSPKKRESNSNETQLTRGSGVSRNSSPSFVNNTSPSGTESTR